MEETKNTWDMPQARTPLKPFTVLMQEPAKGTDEWEDWKIQMQTLDDWIKGPQVEICYDLNNDTDYAVQYQTEQGIKVARVSECVSINGVRWHLQPGKNVIPRPVYEFLMECPDQRQRLSCPEPGIQRNIYGEGNLFKASFA
jgi:hypothetical protein